MARPGLVAWLLVALLVAACSEDGGEAGYQSPGEPGGEAEPLAPFADVLGCDSWTDAVGDGRQWAGHVCTVDEEEVAVVHTFDPADRESFVAYVEDRAVSENADAVVCSDGQPPGPGPWILVGDDWTVSSYDEAEVGRVADALGGEYVGGGGPGEGPPVGPPASFQVPNLCGSR